MKTAYLALGSNLGKRERMLQAAVDALRAPDLRVVRVSSVYETEPRDFRGQPWFLNAVVEVETTLFPRLLLGRTQRIERQLGRRRGVPKGPRTIDIDILLYGDAVIETQELKIPHAALSERRFFLEPLLEIAPGLRHPGTRVPLSQLHAGTLSQAVCRYPSVLRLLREASDT